MAERFNPNTVFKGAQNCAICGEKLIEKDGWRYPKNLGGGLVPYCGRCMERLYKYNSASMGYKLALYMTCAQFSMPYRPELLGKAKEFDPDSKKPFTGYLLALKNAGADKFRGGFQTFQDGMTDITKAFGGEYATLEVDDEMLSDEEYKKGHIGQVKDWGYGPEDRPYTQDDYDQLDKFFEALTENRVNVTKQIEMAIRNICVMKLEQQYSIFKGNFTEAKRLEDIIKAEMEGEQLRKKDELPQDRVRLDDIVLACERAGLVGKSYEELLDIFGSRLFHTKYGYTRDAADQMLLYIVNATRTNEGYAELDRLPDDFAIQDTLGEFAEKPDEIEKQIYRDLHIAPLNMKPKGVIQDAADAQV